MSKLRERLGDAITNFKPRKKEEYNYKDHLNWRDDGNDSHLTDGQGIEDPSKNDFLKGYNMNPYEFKQWASKQSRKVQAAIEVDPMQFTPEYLADKILTLWNGTDGPLQNFFEGFTYLRYNNKLKQQIASILESKGYKVYPVLTDDKPRYAKHEKILREIKASKNTKNILTYCKIALAKSEPIQKLLKEVAELENVNEEDIELANLAAITEYYKLLYPNDFAIGMVEDLTDYKKNTDLKKHKNQVEQDYQISDESLDKIEDYMSGNADPFYKKDYGYSNWSYDPVSDMRTDTTRPHNYELRVSKKKRN
ncbi:MAG: hypothetical protein ACOCRK_01680 [bacterium]